MSSNVLFVNTSAAIEEALTFMPSHGGGETLPVVNLSTTGRANLFLPEETLLRWREKGIIASQCTRTVQAQPIEMVEALPQSLKKLYHALQYQGEEIPISWMAVSDRISKSFLTNWENPTTRKGYELYPTNVTLSGHRLWVLYAIWDETAPKTTPQGGFLLHEENALQWLG
jgi:hypothetical protein